jgi:hypothetical protein
VVVLFLLALLSDPLSASSYRNDSVLRQRIALGGNVRLPAGRFELHTPLELPEGTRLKGNSKGTFLRASDTFVGSAMIVAASDTEISGITLDGNRQKLAKTQGLPPHDLAFADSFASNGILARDVRSITIRNVTLREIASFAILVHASQDIVIDRVRVDRSGSKQSNGRNNTTGGVLLEGGSSHFLVTRSVFTAISGNAVWTHSLYTAPRSRLGEISRNRFRDIGRDAIQVGHASEINVTANRGTRIGYPFDQVDMEGGAMPVAVDTSGDVDHASYTSNYFTELNGKCFDLDGFHDGEVHANTCINRGRASDYPFGHFGVVFNNTNPDMQSRNIRITENVIDGTKFGAIFVIGKGHVVSGNRLTRINLAGCNESHSTFGCIFDLERPELLQAGIYLGDRAERPDETRDNDISNNHIEGHQMATRCVILGAGIKIEEQTIKANVCRNQNFKP